MTLRAKLLLAQAPLFVALAFLSILSLGTVSSIGESAQNILRENYRSVLAAQRMKESIERLDSSALFLLAGAGEKGRLQAAKNCTRFEEELRVEESNITEQGERETAARLRARWDKYQRGFETLFQETNLETARRFYFAELEPSFRAVKDAADEILAMNQDAMVRKSDHTRQASQRLSEIITFSALAALGIGLFASALLTARLLRPLSRLGRAAQRLGEGDLSTRAEVTGRDELARLATEFNAMAEHLQRYRASSLGDLLQAQQAAQSAIDSIPDPVVIFDAASGILNVNQAAETLLRDAPAMDATEPLSGLDPALREFLDRARSHILSGQGAFVPKDFGEAVAVKSFEGERYLLPRGTPLYGEGGGVDGATVILQDVTRLRRFDELRNDLVATVAHEFRTPLTSLRMAIHLCLEQIVGPVTDKQADLLAAAREDCERLQAIVDDLLDLARLQAGRIEMRNVVLSVENLIEGALTEQLAAADGKHLTLRSDISPLAPENLQGDPERLRLVVTNLIANAIRHTPEGGSVIVRVLPVDRFARFEVIDTGPGVPEEYRREIFQRFFRVPGTPGGGAGLGLSIAKEIIEAHGGEIGVDPAPGGGSAFFFTLPIGKADKPG